jgi:hypothetical protein
MDIIIMENQPSRLASLREKSDFVVAMSRYLADKSGPIRPELLPERLGLGFSYNDLSKGDQRILIGTLGRLGWERREWPFWYRQGDDAEAMPALPDWITRKAA